MSEQETPKPRQVRDMTPGSRPVGSDADVLLWHMREAWKGIGGTPEEATGPFSENIIKRYQAVAAKAALCDEIMARINAEAYDKAWPYGAEMDWIGKYEALT